MLTHLNFLLLKFWEREGFVQVYLFETFHVDS